MTDPDYIQEAERVGGGFPVFCVCGNQITDGGLFCRDCEREMEADCD